MIFDEVGSGGVSDGGCAVPVAMYSSVTKYGLGDTLYNVAKARRGVLEKVVIKSIRSMATRRTAGRETTLYQDTFNGLWNEWDLVPLGKALVMVEEHRLRLADEARKLGRC